MASNSEKYASYLIDLIFEWSRALEKFPYLGRMVPEVNIYSIRELAVKNYRIIYSVPDIGKVDILAVRHSPQPLSDLGFRLPEAT